MIALSIALAILGSVARADVVRPAPPDCPRGAIGTTSHAGPYCAATECATAEQCEATWGWRFRTAPVALECGPAGLCVQARDTWGRHGGRTTERVALGSCASDADCGAGIRCELRDRCIVPGSVERRMGPVVEDDFDIVVGDDLDVEAGALALGAILAMALGGAGLARGHQRDRERRAARVREILATRTASEHEVLDIVGGSRELARALAPVADRVRVEAGDDGAIYALEPERERELEGR